MALNLKTFTTRTLTAAVFVTVLLLCICYNYISFSALFLVVSVWGLYEFYQLAEKLGAKPYKAIGLITGALIFWQAFMSNSIFSYNYPTVKLMAICLAFVFLLFMVALFDSKPNTILNLAYTLTGIVYAVVPFTLLLNIACIDPSYQVSETQSILNKVAPYNFHYVLGIILLIWVSDVGAYMVGSFIGKHKLYERISPGKTWEGTVGATLITIACSYIMSVWYPELAWKHWIAISILVCVFGTIGDLVESMLKRQAGVKDSGKIMPGHGGILDRFDSLLFVSPFIYAYLELFVK